MHPNGQAPHILVVNHDPEILDLMRELLAEEGYRVTTHIRAGQDVERIAAMAPNVIVIDYMWPSSDNDWTLLNLLRIDRRTRHIPVILCTGAVTQAKAMADHLISLGIRVVLKPFDIDRLSAEVRNTVEARAPQEPRPISPGE